MSNVIAEEAKLAIHGGTPAVNIPRPPRERWGAPEIEQLKEAIDQPSLFYWNGPQTKLMIERFKQHYPLEYVMPCSSGTAAIHIAVAAAGIGLGDEVITSPVTDMGTVTGILYQNAVPVFADLDPHSYNLDPASVRSLITPKTKAIVAVHLAGNPCDLDALRAIADEHNLVLIEDCAQSWGAMYRGKPVGTVGHIGCWSLNDFKHIACGDGGVVASSDERFGPLLQKFGDKAYDRVNGTRMPEHLAPNYRISELQSAVAAVQLDRMWELTAKRAAAGRALTAGLSEIPGIQPPFADERDRWTSWFYLLRLEEGAFSCDNKEFAAALQAEGVGCSPGYIPVPLYRYPVFTNENFFAGRWPVKELGLTDMDYNQVSLPNTEAILKTSIQLAVNETHDEAWAQALTAGFAKVAAYYRK